MQSKASEDAVGNCKPEDLANGKPIVPCGLVAWSLFNDTYNFKVQNKVLEVNKKDIAWKSDKEKKFGSDVYPKNFQSSGLIGGGQLNSSVPVSISFNLYLFIYFSSIFVKLILIISQKIVISDNSILKSKLINFSPSLNFNFFRFCH